jgi:putative transposase
MVKRNPELTVERQCELLDINRSSVYYVPSTPTAEMNERKEQFLGRLDYWHTKQPSFGVRRLRKKLAEEGQVIGRKLLKQYMDEMGIYAVYPKPNLSKRNQKHKIHPYLLRNLNIYLPNQVWAIDITYIKLARGHMYLTAIIDWYSRMILGWELSDTLDTAPVLQAVKRAMKTHGIPAIINSDQGCQFTSDEYTAFLKLSTIRQSMDGKARWVDNVIIERWFRSLKTENIYINEYTTPRQLRIGIRDYIEAYNTERPHQSLNYETPAAVYRRPFAA